MARAAGTLGRVGGGDLLDRLRGWRDRLVGDPAFRRRAAAFPLTRPIARRRARALFDLSAGFVYSQVLLACVRLRLFDVLAEGPHDVPALARRLVLPPPAARRLLDAAVALRLAERRAGDRYGLGPLGAAMVGNPAVAAMVEHHPLLYADLADPVALLRGETGPGRLAPYWPYAAAAADEIAADAVAPYSALMAASQPLVAAEILDAYPFARHRRLLDVGGGEGAFLIEAGRRWPHLDLTLLDLPPVAERARARIAAAGLADRARTVGGDFFAALPGTADVATLVRVLHDHDDPGALALLTAIRDALAPGGRLVIAEPMARTPGAEPAGDAYFGFYLMAMGRGRPRSPDEIAALARRAGFSSIRPRRTHTPLLVQVLVASA